jgi:GDP-4-dehydro-6-deoxy-D-mannose reductase
VSKVVVTGAGGFIGRHLCPRLQAAGHEVYAVSSAFGDVADPRTWAKFPSAAVVVHLAGRTFVPESWQNPSGYMHSNLMGVIAALDYCRAQRARFVFLSSYLYGNVQTQPISEDVPLRANNPYGLSKLMAEDACRFYAERYDVPVTILRLFNVYGPGQRDDFLVPLIIRQVLGGKEVRVKDLRPKRDYVHVDDVGEAILRGVGFNAALGVFNIGTGKSHSVGDLIQLALQAAGTNLPVISSEEVRPDEIMDTVADISRARAQLGWVPRWTLAAGVGALVGDGRASQNAF